MNYFLPYAASADETVVSAWDTQVARATDAPWLGRLLAERGNELFPDFAARYNELRALQRSLARSRWLSDRGSIGSRVRSWMLVSPLKLALHKSRR
jgi:hypothetical protein